MKESIPRSRREAAIPSCSLHARQRRESAAAGREGIEPSRAGFGGRSVTVTLRPVAPRTGIEPVFILIDSQVSTPVDLRGKLPVGAVLLDKHNAESFRLPGRIRTCTPRLRTPVPFR